MHNATLSLGRAPSGGTRIGVRLGYGMPLIVGRGVGVACGVNVGSSPGGGDHEANGVGVERGGGGCVSMSSVCVAP